MTNLILKDSESFFELTLNRPEKRNALDQNLMMEMVSCLKDLSARRTSQKYLLLKGSGKSFCAGADLDWMRSMANYTYEENVKDSKLLFDVFDSLYSFPLPVVCSVQGHVFGGGLGLLAASDYVVADPKTLFSFSEVKLGLIPAVISSFVLSKCQPSLAQAYMLSGERFTTQNALELKLVHRVSDHQNLLEEVTSQFESSSTEALVACKKLIKKQSLLRPNDFKDFTVNEISKIRVSDEAQKRMKRFLKA